MFFLRKRKKPYSVSEVEKTEKGIRQTQLDRQWTTMDSLPFQVTRMDQLLRRKTCPKIHFHSDFFLDRQHQRKKKRKRHKENEDQVRGRTLATATNHPAQKARVGKGSENRRVMTVIFLQFFAIFFVLVRPAGNLSVVGNRDMLTLV